MQFGRRHRGQIVALTVVVLIALLLPEMAGTQRRERERTQSRLRAVGAQRAQFQLQPMRRLDRAGPGRGRIDLAPGRTLRLDQHRDGVVGDRADRRIGDAIDLVHAQPDGLRTRGEAQPCANAQLFGSERRLQLYRGRSPARGKRLR
ncbi:MAG: hypothetical protein JF591_04320 [Lysobacter sp.]|nr:hypothetical protein [Lysobacter sp.]